MDVLVEYRKKKHQESSVEKPVEHKEAKKGHVQRNNKGWWNEARKE